jgi:hypothetical protein
MGPLPYMGTRGQQQGGTLPCLARHPSDLDRSIAVSPLVPAEYA